MAKWGGGLLLRRLTVPSPPPNPPATKFASQGDAHVITDIQIKFLYYPLICYLKFFMSEIKSPQN